MKKKKEVGEGIKLSDIDRKELFLVTKVNFKSYDWESGNTGTGGIFTDVVKGDGTDKIIS